MEKRYIHISLSQEKVAELRGRQSVRTTFRLPERSILALSLLASQLGIKQKSLFDHLGEDIDTLRACAAAAERREDRECVRTSKTYVVSKRTLENLERVAAASSASRDALVASSIERIVPLLLEEQKKHRQRKEVLADARRWLAQGEELLRRSLTRLEQDDPAMEEVAGMLREAGRAFANLEDMVERGEKIEQF